MVDLRSVQGIVEKSLLSGQPGALYGNRSMLMTEDLALQSHPVSSEITADAGNL